MAVYAGSATESPQALLRSTPWIADLLDLHRFRPERYPCLLESALHGTPQARYDILFAFPGEVLRLDAGLRLHGPGRVAGDDDFLRGLDRWWRGLRLPSGDCPLPFQGGWCLFLAYELAAQVEPVLRLPRDLASPLPVACAVRCPAAVIRDHAAGTCWLVAEPGQGALLDAMAADLAEAGQGGEAEAPPLPPRLEEAPATDYLHGVRRIHDYILAGDVFQVNLSRSWEGRLAQRGAATDAALYRRLRSANPAPFAGLWTLDDWAIVSSPARRRAARTDPPWRGACAAIPRSGPSTSCSSTWSATTWAGSACRAR